MFKIITSHDRGNEIYYDGSDWLYTSTDKIVDKMPEDLAPEQWRDRCSGDGHKRYVDPDGNRRYSDDNVLLEDEPWRPCAKCGKYPNENGDDHCIQNLGKVINACCGHGVNKGYIQFDNGITIRGYFEVEKD